MFINAMISGPVYGGAGLWVNSLENEYGWSRTQLSIAFSIGQLEGSLAAPLVGFLIDRFGGKRTIMIGAVFAAFGFLIMSQTRPISNEISNWFDPLIFYIAYVVIMVGVSLGSWIPTSVILNSWFNKFRSLALSVGSVGFAVGTFAIVPILAFLVNPNLIGWRGTAFILVFVFVLLLIPEFKILRNHPEEIGEIPDGRINEKVDSDNKNYSTINSPLPKDFTLSEALREKTFWILAVGHGASAMLTSTMMVHLILAFRDQGISLENSALMWGITMGIGGASMLLGGIIGDRVNKVVTITLFGCLQSIGVAFAVFVDSIPMAIIFAIVYGFGFGARGVITMAIRGEYFGRKSLGKIVGISAMPMMLMQMITPIIAAQFYDKYGDYFIGFLVIAGAGFAGSLLLMFARKPIHPSEKTA